MGAGHSAWPNWCGPDAGLRAGTLQLLVLQPTPFCNLACDYCYLPSRDDRRRMSLDTVDLAMRKVFASGLPAPDLSIVWHAGEPLVLPVAYYESAFAIVRRHQGASLRITHHVQTNATLVNDAWCRLFRDHGTRVGVSIDGPAWLHDRHRRGRRGEGTHARVMRGIETLRGHGLSFHVICVLSRESLDHADEIYEFFTALDPQAVCFNIEEVEGVHAQSSLDSADAEAKLAAFFTRVLERVRRDPPAFRIREIDDVVGALRDPAFGAAASNGQNEAFRIISIGHDGSVSTFSPELLGLSHPTYGSFAFANIRTGDLVDVLADPRFRTVAGDIERGVRQCQASCRFFPFCRGGAPVNKLSERGTFDATETMFCRLTQKTIVNRVLAALDEDLRSTPRAAWVA